MFERYVLGLIKREKEREREQENMQTHITEIMELNTKKSTEKK